VAELEKRLDELTTQLKTTKSDAEPTNQVNAQGRKKTGFNFNHLFPRDREDVQDPALSNSDTTPGSSSIDADTPMTNMSASVSLDSLWPLPLESESYLRIFRQSMEPVFPFIKLNSSINGLEFPQQHPFLWKCVMMVCSHGDGLRQTAMGELLLKDIGELAFGRRRPTTEHLQGILLILAW
jgi:hypothetical protein